MDLSKASSGDGSALLRTALIGLVAALLAFALQSTTPLRLFDGAASDLRVAFLAPPPHAPVVVVAIDEASVAAMRAQESGACSCRSPVSARFLAGLIAALDAKGAKVIGVDLLLDNDQPGAGKAVLADTLAKARSPVVLVESGEAAAEKYAPRRWASARLTGSEEYDAVVRTHDPLGGESLTAAMAALGAGAAPIAPFEIRWRAPQAETGAFLAIPAFAVADAPEDWITGAYVLIGRMETDPTQPPVVEDRHLTPLRLRADIYGRGMAGVEAHAHILSQMLDGDRIVRPTISIGFALLLSAGLAGAALGRRGGGWRLGVAWVAAGLLGYAAAAVFIYAGALVLLPASGPMLAFVGAYLLSNRVLAAKLDGERRFLETAFSHYLPPAVVADLVRDPKRLQRRAEMRAITVVSTDVAGFSPLVAAHDPGTIEAVMNAYFDGMIAIFWRHGAMIDKIIGDGMLAIFGAPTDQPDHAARALACVRDLDAFAEAFLSAAPDRFGVEFGQTRIGVETGQALVGNFGGALRFDYTAFGEVVVRAVRLQAANKILGGRVLIGAGTAAAVSGSGLVSAGNAALTGVAGAADVFRPN